MTSIADFQLLLVLLLAVSSCDEVSGDNSYSTQHITDPGDNPSPALALTTTARQKDGYQINRGGSPDPGGLPGRNQGSLCASYDEHPASSGGNNEVSKRGFEADGKKHGGGEAFSSGMSGGNKRVSCPTYCFTLWMADPSNKSKVTVSKQGCWLLSDEKECQENHCISNIPPRPNNTHFCCCSGDLCNVRFQNVYDPTEHTTVTTQPSPLAVGPLQDHSYKKKTIIVALVSVISVSLVIVFLYLAYRLCLTPKPSSPQSSSVARVETPEPLLLEFNIDQLKVEEVLVRGRYSEVRRGWLGDKEVAVKIYQPHHRQYYYNERNAFTQPFMDHENLVRFFGAKEQEDPETSFLQYIIVTEYIPLGTLTSYLKHNTIDWCTLCHMCQGISRGLAHLHADAQKGDLFKPAIAHRDLNTRNILVNPDLTCMIADLGFSVGMIGSKIIKNGVAENAEQATLADVGTLRYMAPEVFDGAVNLRDCEASLKQIDVYALGLVIWEIASRCIELYQGAPVPDYQLPFQAEAGPHPSFEEMQVLVVKYKTRPRFPEVWKDSSPAVRSLKETIEDCWDTDAEARLTSLCVQERIADMAAVWAHGNKHRGVTPTLNATMNLPESNMHNTIHSGSAIVSNGLMYIPAYVDRNDQTGEEVGHQREEETKSPLISNSPIYKEDHGGSNATYSGSVTSPLISNFGHFSNSTFGDEDGRVRSWLYDQSVSGSTVDTLLPPTPSLEEQHTEFGTPHPSPQPAEPPPVKASNVLIAKNKAVILHPNQGRNPTVERNTHKRSDEELTVSGNVLVGPGKSDSSHSEGDQNNRRGTYSTRSAPPNRNGDSGSYDRIETIESSSLVQNDSLGQQNIRPRNTPIPYFQNHVHSDHVTGAAIAPYLTRPKLANISGNRGSYLRLQGEDANPHVQTASVQMLDQEEAKTLKHKLSKLMKPKDLGLKFSRMVFRGKCKKSQDIPPVDSLDVEAMTGRGEDSSRMSGQYINNGLDSSPVNRTASNCALQPGAVSMEVQLVGGAVITRTCGDTQTLNPVSHQNGNVMAGPQGRLSATNVMRLGVMANPNHEELASPSLFPESGDNSLVNDSIYLSKLNQENSVPMKNLAAARLSTDYGSMHPVILNPAYGLDGSAETSSEELKTTRLSVASAGIQDNIVPCDHQHSAREGASDLDLISASLSCSSKFPVHLTVGPDSSASNNSGSFNLCLSSKSAASEPAVVPVNDPDILNTVIQSPQNKTVGPLNASLPLSSTGGHSPHVMVKKCAQELQGAYSSQNPASYLGPHYHQSDTKGGNSIMHCIHMDTVRTQSKDTSGGAARRSVQLPAKSPQNNNTRVSGNQGHDMAEGTAALPQFVLRKSDSRLSQSQSVTDLETQHCKLWDSGDAENTWASKKEQETDFSKNCTFSKKARPKSLSLKGHSYTQGRGRSASSSSLSTSSLPPVTTQSSLQTSSHIQRSNGGEPLTLIVPTVTLDKCTPLIQSDDTGREIAEISVTAATSDVLSAVCKIRSAGANNNSCVVANAATGNHITSHDVVTAGVDRSNSSPVNTCHVHGTEWTSHTTTDNKTNSNAGDQIRSSLKDRSDSSEKIRKRIKTPVSFKKGRLSLYDDRLMTQSVDFVSLYDMEGDVSTKGQGDSNNNRNVAQLYSDSAPGCEHTGKQQSRSHAGAAQISRRDYQKMIKSESDLVV